MTNATNPPPTFAQWVRQLRLAGDLTQETLAEQAFCSVQAVRAFEAGRRRPSLAMALRLADVLGVSGEPRDHFLHLARTELDTASTEPVSAPTGSTAPAPLALPSTTTPFIGRATELNALRHLFLGEQQRLVTIVGPGGMGKTRLALDLTTALAAHFADGAAFVSLAAITDVYHVPSTIASALQIPLQGATEAGQQVNRWFASRRMLLTLDNVEQLLADPALVAWVRGILAVAPGLHLLITSRERLRMSGERTFELAGLPLPAPDRPIEQADAALLFLERAQQVMADFVINNQNQTAIRQICHLLEGMPLGIELAAAWVHVLTPQEIAAEIRRSIDFLARATRDMTPRHRSMRAVFDHSWKLLNADERSALMKLSVFRGGCTREAALQVAAAPLPVLASLIDKSLLRKSPHTPTRYTMHELVRQYAADQLANAPDHMAQTVVEAHAVYYHDLVREAERQIWGANIAAVMHRLEAENDNVRAALAHFLATPAAVAQSIDLAGLLWRFWEIRGYIAEGRNWLMQALQRAAEPPPPSRWLALHGAGNLASDQDDYASARAHYQECLQLLQSQLPTLTDPDAMLRMRYRIGTTLTNLGNCALRQGELAEALTFSEEALALQRQLAAEPAKHHLNNAIGIAITTTNLALIKLRQAEIDQAAQFSAESLALYRMLGDERGIGWNLRTSGAIAQARGQYAQAAALYAEARLLFEKLAAQSDLVTLYFQLGELARVQGTQVEAESHYQAALTLAQGLGSKSEMALLLDRLSLVACQMGRYDQALNWSEQSIALYRELHNRLGLCEALQHRGDLAAALGDQTSAERYYKQSQQVIGEP